MKENLSAKEIAFQLGCSTTTIKLYLRKFGLNKGGSGRAIHREKLSYGKRIVGHRLEVHKAEVQVVATIRKMYADEGLKPTAIARLLDTMKVPTKRQGKKWDHSTVIDILEREGVYQISRNSPRKGGHDGKSN